MAVKPDVLILSGFLGSGKTTLLVRIAEHLRATRGDDYGIAIIENEIGSTSVDTGVVQQAGYSVTEMLAGCVCCTLIGQLVPAIEKLAAELEPDLIIIEATGVATPEGMRDNIVKYAGCNARVVTLADASRWSRIRIPLRQILLGQIEPADVVVVNKIDLAAEEQLAEVEQDVRDMNAAATVVFASADSPMSEQELETVLEGVR